MKNNITKMAKELLMISEDIEFRFDYSKEPEKERNLLSVNDFEICIFEQTWGSTCLGFGGVGGQAMTAANTYVFVPVMCNQDCFVYFGGRFAYSCPWCEDVKEDILGHCMKSVAQSGRYRRNKGERE